MKFSALLFDLDGTLVDSLPDLATAANCLRADLCLPALSLEQVRACVGDGARMLVSRALPDGGFSEQRLAQFLNYYQQNLAAQTHPYGGIVEMLQQLPANCVALVTNKPQTMTEQLIEHLGWNGHFAVTIGGDRYAEKKPHPLPLQKALDELRIPAHRALMVGDHHTDLRAGVAAGARTCFCSWGYGDDGGEEPDFRVNSVSELRSLLGTEN